MKAILNYKDKKIEIEGIKRCNFFEKIFGLMFMQRERAEALLFDFKNNTRIAIHSYFVFFPFIAIWLNAENRIVDYKLVMPFKGLISPLQEFSKLIEIPINKKYQEVVEVLVGDRKV
ncbi:MAG: hypothetical protein AABY22_13035 [Nanoarchaeota archaeon]